MKLRADLAIALFTDKKPMFFSDSVSWEPYIAKLQSTSPGSLPKHFPRLDMKFHYIWEDLREFARSANLAFQTGQKIDCVLFQEILVSVQYRLLLLDVSTGSLVQAIYVGMLAFSTNIFLQMQGFAMRFEKLFGQLRDSILKLQRLEDDSMVDLKLWLLFIASLFNVGENKNSWLQPEMRKTLESSNQTSWKIVRNTLKRYLWIDALHDNAARRSFEDANTSTSEAFMN